MRRVLVELGDRSGTRDALALAAVLCERTGAELVVEREWSGVVDLIVSGRLPAEAPAAVAVPPRGLAGAELRLERVAVGHDGSRESTLTLSLAGRLATSLESTLTILGVVELAPDLARLAEAEEERLSRHLRQALEAVPHGVSAELRLLSGLADRSLIEAAASVDLLVLGSRSHYGPTPRMRPGRVGASVASAAPCPTVIATA
jgi:nucleotide-binding universal stress UspA family protein